MPFNKGLMSHSKKFERSFHRSNGKIKGLIAKGISPTQSSFTEVIAKIMFNPLWGCEENE